MLRLAARALHNVAPLRAIARKTLSNVTLRTPFWGGVIYCNIADHSTLWIHGAERWDCWMQDRLVELARAHHCFVDIGANVGVMSLSVALRTPVPVLAVEPSARIAPLLERSIAANELAQRVELLKAAVTDHDGITHFTDAGPLIGHVSAQGRAVPCIDIRALLNRVLAAHDRVLVKLDVEGLETMLLPLFADIPERERLTLVVEIHPRGTNDVADPDRCLEALRASGARYRTLEGAEIEKIEHGWPQVVARWPKRER